VTVDERFWNQVDKHGPIQMADLGRCLVWTGSRGSGGYGQLRLSNPRRLVYAHRYAYEVALDPIPADLEVAHVCGNHTCVNPDHLKLVDARARVLRGEAASAKQARQEFCKKEHPLAGENVYTRPSSPNRRECCICIRERQRAKRPRRAAIARATNRVKAP
jgi:hypothetical protein